ncbi:ABC transporter ATP-binding protein [Clostridium sp. MT-14]|uniref:ABC transporter ATP-binding protein n=1 Tax=Clostridium aromativorans TaxID=2836848 RepID=A0ABS8N9S4_9CLOT|nr:MULTISPECIES: ABC transporter ATP-binding protein [Clostridium]KAA8677564.1 ABC transporter ATP-binding protein [Clostridium sp. HV4-5-A1G]MCC9295805.1 ABC transporter ATP-binding protein [Clostridium aromativorans]CAB1246667.1 iron-dicitrate ABC transporter (ATP-binding protein) [Clostridiaceae bacterium BL-3]
MELKVENLKVNYGNKIVVKDISFDIHSGEIVTIIGPNGSGKSTLIKAVGRCLKPAGGNVYLDGTDIRNMNTRAVAQKLSILPQMKNIASDISVEELVSYGRYPHLKFRRRLDREDMDIIDWALEKTGLVPLRQRFVTTLSGGEEQRAWLAMCLAQRPEVLLLDEPTTFLDISYQMEILELIKELNETLGLTVIMVLHDLNQAARYSDTIVVIKDGKLWDMGMPYKIIKKELLRKVFGIEADIYEDKINKCPFFIPKNVII